MGLSDKVQVIEHVATRASKEPKRYREIVGLLFLAICLSLYFRVHSKKHQKAYLLAVRSASPFLAGVGSCID
jgi:hypothetical protein